MPALAVVLLQVYPVVQGQGAPACPARIFTALINTGAPVELKVPIVEGTLSARMQ